MTTTRGPSPSPSEALGPYRQWLFLAVRCLLEHSSAREKRRLRERVRAIRTVHDALGIIAEAEVRQLESLRPSRRSAFPRSVELAKRVPRPNALWQALTTRARQLWGW